MPDYKITLVYGLCMWASVAVHAYNYKEYSILVVFTVHI